VGTLIGGERLGVMTTVVIFENFSVNLSLRWFIFTEIEIGCFSVKEDRFSVRVTSLPWLRMNIWSSSTKVGKGIGADALTLSQIRD